MSIAGNAGPKQSSARAVARDRPVGTYKCGHSSFSPFVRCFAQGELLRRAITHVALENN